MSGAATRHSPAHFKEAHVGQRILILGGDGYLGWPTAMAFSRQGHRVAVVDNFAKRQWELELGVRPLFPIPTLHERAHAPGAR